MSLLPSACTNRNNAPVIPRRARPTLRVLQEDLRDGWESSHAPPRAGAEGLDPLSPLSELPHPIIRKAAESFGDKPADDTYVGPIKSSTRINLLEIKTGQWRGGVWIDPDTDVCWLVAAGLAKGGHTDHDDFYQRLKRANESGEIDRWTPTDRRPPAAQAGNRSLLLNDWERDIQRRALEALRSASREATATFALPHPSSPTGRFGECILTLTQTDEPGFRYEEFIVEVELANEFRASALGWQATIRVLIAINPPETGWDRVGDTYSTIADVGSLALRLNQLQAITDRGELAQSRPNDRAHYAHRRNLALSTVVGLGVQSMCGIFFVPYQNHESFPRCEVCEERFLSLPE